MVLTNFLSLPEVVLLEIFTYLSCEDLLYAFVNLQESHVVNLLMEHGAFRHICFSSQLPRRQYLVLSNGIWRYNLVRSLVCKDMFSDTIGCFTPCQIFPCLTELRLLSLRCLPEGLEKFIIAHSSTLKRLILEKSAASFLPEAYKKILETVLPHLNQLTFLDTDWASNVYVRLI